MRTIIALLCIVVSFPALGGVSTVDEYQSDLNSASECRPLEGRRLWMGEKGYYIEAWLFATKESGQIDHESASAIPFAENDEDALSVFAKACR